MDSAKYLRKYSIFRARFWAGFIDGFVLLPFGFVGLFVDSLKVVWVTIAWVAIGNSIWWIYTVVGHAIYGQTVGKRHQEIMVRDNRTKGPISWQQAILRDSFVIVVNTLNAALIIYVILYDISQPSVTIQTIALVLNYGSFIWFLTEIITCLTNHKRRALHDFIAGTVVVRIDE